MIEIIKFNRSKFEEANVPFTPIFVTHERLLLEPYQTWQYCEVADIEPFQGQSDQIFQFSIIQNRVRIPFFARTERAPGETHGLPLLSPRKVGERRKRTWESLPFPLVLPIEARWKRKEHARENIKKVCKRKRKNGNLWTRLSERCPPSWSRLTTGVDQRNFAITLLPSSFLPIYLSIYLSLSLALFHSFFFTLALFLPLSFPYLLVLSR